MSDTHTTTPSELVENIGHVIASGFPQAIKMRGEVFSVSVSQTGHAYMQITNGGDTSSSSDGSGGRDGPATKKRKSSDHGNVKVTAVVWKSKLTTIPQKPRSGDIVEVCGRVEMYGERVQFISNSVRVLHAQGGKVKQTEKDVEEQLYAEGLFSRESISLPSFPTTVGVVTSSKGAVIHDIQQTFARRAPWVQLVLRPTSVQGDDAPRDLAQALEDLATISTRLDAVVIGRGGGSKEDLEAFNSPLVVQAIFKFASTTGIPVVSAVGHESDFSLSDRASDVRAATPTAAAELLSFHTIAFLFSHIKTCHGKMVEALEDKMGALDTRLDSSWRGLVSCTKNKISHETQCAGMLNESLRAGAFRKLSMAEDGVKTLNNELKREDPQTLVQRRKVWIPSGNKMVREPRNKDMLCFETPWGTVWAQVVKVDPDESVFEHTAV
jgi:exodeoxyribonuclease VII large subunit